MKKSFSKSFLSAMVFILGATAAVAQVSTPTNSPSPATSATSTEGTPPATAPSLDKPLELGGKFGIGYDYIHIDEIQGPNYTDIFSQLLLSLDATYWLSDKSALDLLATANVGSNPGFDFNGNSANFPNTTWGAGLQFRYNLAAPARNLRLQALLRATYAQYNQQEVTWTNNNISNQIQQSYSETFLMSVGLGFEYYMPFCDSLSLQGNLAFSGSSNDGWVKEAFNPSQNLGISNYTVNYSYLRTAVVLTGLTLSGLSVHFYF